MADVQRFYSDNFNGRTFQLDSLELVQASSPKESYFIIWNGRNIYEDGVEFNGNMEAAVVAELYARGYPTPPAQNEDGYSVVIFVKGAGGYAGGREFPSADGGRAILGDWCIDSLTGGVPEGTYWWSGLRLQTGAAAHELGHTFDLPHPDAYGGDFAGTVMGNWWDYPTIGLDDWDRTHLAAAKANFFPTTPLTDVVPYDGMIVDVNIVLRAGTYSLPHGISIGASGVNLDLNGASLEGADCQACAPTCGVSSNGVNGITIKNGNVHDYYYGVCASNSAGITILNNDLSNNWVDPASLTNQPPFLDINVGPNFGDRTNLGGGIFLRNVTQANVTGNTLRDQENGMDLYNVSMSSIIANDASNNTGWGIHLHASSDNIISNNIADHCTRVGLFDSAGFLVVYGSDRNQFLGNSFRYSGDGFFIGNENGCPSNDNLIQGNDGSFAGANAFEATFSSGNRFINNLANGSNYGFWLGYSHSGNIVQGNSIHANNANGIEIEHGQHNIIEGNTIIGNGGDGILLRTDGLVHFPPNQFPCLNLPGQEASSYYLIRENTLQANFGPAIELINTTDSTVVNNLIDGEFGGTALDNGARNVWSATPAPGTNIVNGPYLGGNFWSDYDGMDINADGLGDTHTPYTNGGLINLPGDPHPLIGNPETIPFPNPEILNGCNWHDLGRNLENNGTAFDTANGAHFATDGNVLYLLQGSNSSNHFRYDPTTHRFEPRAPIPEGVEDGGDYKNGGGTYYATVGVGFDPFSGDGNASRMYAYDPVGDRWRTTLPTIVSGQVVGNEALAFDPIHRRLYATTVRVKDASVGGDASLQRRLAIYFPDIGFWIGTTSVSPDLFQPGSEAEYLDGKIYVYRGGFSAAAVSGADSYLDVYDIETDLWSRTPSLLDSGVVPGFLTGSFDVWGVSLAADGEHHLMFLTGGERNRLLYVFDPVSQTWAAGPQAPYDGGWGSSLEYVATSRHLYLIDGRNAHDSAQGMATLSLLEADLNTDCRIDLRDFGALQDCFTGTQFSVSPSCIRADLNLDEHVDLTDLREVLEVLSGP